jgi:hypothetical protein
MLLASVTYYDDEKETCVKKENLEEERTFSDSGVYIIFVNRQSPNHKRNSAFFW